MRESSFRNPRPSPDDVIATYEATAETYTRDRDKSLFERRWLDRALAYAPGRKVLDLGCGPGRPIAAYLRDRRCTVTGVDASPAMLTLFEAALPGVATVEADMRGLDLGETFDLILGWNSLFHLAVDDQRAMFPVFARHAHERTVLMFTSGPDAGEATGRVADQPIYHASLAPWEYRDLLSANGFEELAFVPEDAECRGHSVWLARSVGW
ncbi:MAG: methyltransferase domain-containing protein [Maritimibacter sp.]|nr:methyltransferase domain-containing protein [Maritimibacter sp.]